MFVLAHLSDPHLARRRGLRELAGKRALGYINWQRSRAHPPPRDVLDAITRDLRQRPDHIAVTGDLVNIALPAEFAAARAGWRRSARRAT